MRVIGGPSDRPETARDQRLGFLARLPESSKIAVPAGDEDHSQVVTAITAPATRGNYLATNIF